MLPAMTLVDGGPAECAGYTIVMVVLTTLVNIHHKRVVIRPAWNKRVNDIQRLYIEKPYD